MFVFFCLSNISTAKEFQLNPNSLDDIKKEVQEIIKKNRHKFSLEEDFLARVEITLNDNNEIVVLQTNCNDKRINSFIKNALNYKKIRSSPSNEYQKYVVPLRFEKGNFLMTR